MLTFDPELHEYRFAGQVVPHVSDFSDRLKDLGWATPEQIAAAGERGTDVHYATVLNDLNDLVEGSVTDEVRPFLNAYRKFMREVKPEWYEIEKPVYHPTFKYAGTLDRAGLVLGKFGIVDLKTGIQTPVTGLQLGGYELAWNAGGYGPTVQTRIGLYLRKDGTYKMVPYDDPSHVRGFIALVTLNQWHEQNNG